MKKILVFLLLVCMLFSAAGCSVLDLAPKDVVFSIDDYDLQITANNTFEKTNAGNFDLQITNNLTYISIMAYRYNDLATDSTPQDAYDIQNTELFSRRTAVTCIEEKKTQTLSQNKVLTQALYSAEKDGVKNYYATYLIDFPNKETFAWVLITATPSVFESNRNTLHTIVCSLTPIQ